MRRFGIACACCLAAFSLNALTVAEKELRSGQPVNFVNYQGRYTKIVTPAELRTTGLALSRQAVATNRKYVARQQYSIIRAIDARETTRFDADIFMLEPKSDIVDINGVRDLLGGYLEGIYGYSARDSRVLATFVTYYNALYRGRLDFFRERYKNVVLRNLIAASVGISRNYRDWPGRTQMLIPLSATTNGGKPKINIEKFTGPDVMTNLQKQPDKGITDRRDLIEIKKDDLKKQQDDLDKQKKKLEDDKNALKKQDEDLAKKKDDLKKETDPVKADLKKDEIKKQDEDLTKKKDEVKKDDQTVIKQQQDLDKKKDEIKKDEAALKKDEKTVVENKLPQTVKDDLKRKEDEIDKTKQDLDKKAEELKKREEDLKKGELDRNVFDGGLYYLKVIEPLAEGHFKNEMVLINPATRKIALVSPFKNICGNRYDIYSGGAVVVGYGSDHTTGHFLVLLDPKKLEVSARGKANVYWKSFVEVKGEHAYAVVQDGGHYLGKFDAKLEQIARSKATIDKDSFISFFGEYIYVNSPDKSILVLSAGDLSLVDTIRP